MSQFKADKIEKLRKELQRMRNEMESKCVNKRHIYNSRYNSEEFEAMCKNLASELDCPIAIIDIAKQDTETFIKMKQSQSNGFNFREMPIIFGQLNGKYFVLMKNFTHKDTTFMYQMADVVRCYTEANLGYSVPMWDDFRSSVLVVGNLAFILDLSNTSDEFDLPIGFGQIVKEII